MSGGAAEVIPSRFAYTALMVDGSVVAWGTNTTIVGASAYSAYTDITAVVANEGAFAGISSAAGLTMLVELPIMPIAANKVTSLALVPLL